MVFDIKPIADILALATDGDLPAFQSIQDRERNELFGEVIRAVIVRAIG